VADVEAVEYLVGHDAGIRGVYVDPDRLPLKQTVNLIPALLSSQDRKVIYLEG